MKIIHLVLLALGLVAPSFVTAQTACDTPPKILLFQGSPCLSPQLGGCGIDSSITFWVQANVIVQGSCFQVNWDFGDGTTASGSDLTTTFHTYSAPGTYNVKTTITNNAGSDTYGPVSIRIWNGGYEVGNGSNTKSIRTYKNAGVFSLRISRGRDIGTSSIDYETYDDSAKAGLDYTAVSGTLTFAPGESVKYIPIPIIDDHVYHPGRFGFRLSNPQGDYALGQYQFPYYIEIWDDAPRPQFTISPRVATIAEDAGSFTFHITRSVDTGADMSVLAYVYYPKGANAIAQERIQFHPGDIVHDFVAALPNDVIYLGDREMSVRVEPDLGQGDSYPFILTEDDPQPAFTIDDVTVPAGSTFAEFTVHISVPAFIPYTLIATPMPGTAQPGSDYDPTPVQVDFAHDDVVKTFRVPLTGHPESAGRSFAIELSALPNMITYGIARGHAACVIAAGPHVEPSSLQLANGETGKLTLDLGSPATSVVTGTIATSDPSALSVPETVSFAAGESSHDISVEALAPGRSLDVTITLGTPINHTFTIPVTTFEAAVGVFDAQSLQLQPGTHATVKLSLQPAQDVETVVSLMSTRPDIVGVPSAVSVPPGGLAEFEATTKAIGTSFITATLPPRNGGATSLLEINVSAQPMTIAAVTPAQGLTSAPTPVTISGTGFAAPCTVSFGDGVEADAVVLSSEALAATAPAHAAGAADVSVRCGSASAKRAHAFLYAAPRPRAARH